VVSVLRIMPLFIGLSLYLISMEPIGLRSGTVAIFGLALLVFCVRTSFECRPYPVRFDSRRRTRLSVQDDRSLGPAYTRQDISSIFLLIGQPGFNVHLNGAAQNSSSARAA